MNDVKFGFLPYTAVPPAPTFDRWSVDGGSGARCYFHAAPLLAEKRAIRARDEAAKPLAAYREEELAQMRRNFYGFDPSYHVARFHFVQKSPASWTPRHLARHRDLGWQPPGD